MDLHVGMPMVLDAPSGPFEQPIVAVFRDYMSERGSVIMARGLYQRHWADATVNRFFVSVQPPATVEEVRTAITSRVQGVYVLGSTRRPKPCATLLGSSRMRLPSRIRSSC